MFRDSLELVRGPRRRGGGENANVFKTTRSENEGASSLKADRKTKAVMPELVTPELTLVRVADKEALDKYATARTAAGANYQLMGISRS